MSAELDENSTFYRRIETNPEICTNCYRRLYITEEPHPDANAASDHREYSDSVYFAYFESRNKSHPSVKRSYCKCGAVDRLKLRPFDKGDMMVVAQRINTHLEDLGLEYDEDEYFSVVRDRKSDPDMQFNEEKIFEEAIEVAVSEEISEND